MSSDLGSGTGAIAGTTQRVDSDDWPDLQIRTEARRPRIRPGVYQARSAALEAITIFRSRRLVLFFDVFEGEYSVGPVLARIPYYLRLPERGRALGQSSKLARLFGLARIPITRRDRLPMNALRAHIWLIEVGDVTTSHEKNPLTGQPRVLPEELWYSAVRFVRERMA